MLQVLFAVTSPFYSRDTKYIAGFLHYLFAS